MKILNILIGLVQDCKMHKGYTRHEAYKEHEVHRTHKRRRVHPHTSILSIMICVCLFVCPYLTGCGPLSGNSGGGSDSRSSNISLSDQSSDVAPVTKSGVYFDTVISVTLYGKDKEQYIDGCFELADKYEALFSKSVESSDIARVNASNGKLVKVSDETIYIMKLSKKYSELSGGKFSLVCGALTSLWNIGNEEKVPEEKDIMAAMALCGDDLIEINEDTCEMRILKPGVKLDFGACAKGYIADKMKEYLVSEGIESGIISLGGNILLIGNKPVNQSKKAVNPPAAAQTTDINSNINRDVNRNVNNDTNTETSGLYTIGIAKPFTKNNEMITTLKLADISVVTSGNYQRYFERDGKLYHHIIDLTTGYPADTGLNSVSIICPSSVEADIMSTTCYLLGKEEGTRLAESLSMQSIFISSDNTIIYNSLKK